MKTLRIFNLMFAIYFTSWIAENAYFGWNLKPQSEAEEICDYLLNILLTLSFTILFLPAYKKYKKWLVKKNL